MNKLICPFNKKECDDLCSAKGMYGECMVFIKGNRDCKYLWTLDEYGFKEPRWCSPCCKYFEVDHVDKSEFGELPDEEIYHCTYPEHHPAERNNL